MPPCPQLCGGEYCRKPLPAMPPCPAICGGDYCRKPLVPCPRTCEPWYTCGLPTCDRPRAGCQPLPPVADQSAPVGLVPTSEN
jgi:hypothetical protein